MKILNYITFVVIVLLLISIIALVDINYSHNIEKESLNQKITELELNITEFDNELEYLRDAYKKSNLDLVNTKNELNNTKSDLEVSKEFQVYLKTLNELNIYLTTLLTHESYWVNGEVTYVGGFYDSYEDFEIVLNEFRNINLTGDLDSEVKILDEQHERDTLIDYIDELDESFKETYRDMKSYEK